MLDKLKALMELNPDWIDDCLDLFDSSSEESDDDEYSCLKNLSILTLELEFAKYSTLYDYLKVNEHIEDVLNCELLIDKEIDLA